MKPLAAPTVYEVSSRGVDHLNILSGKARSHQGTVAVASSRRALLTGNTCVVSIVLAGLVGLLMLDSFLLTSASSLP